MASTHGGSITSFDIALQRHIKQGSKFKVVSSGLSRKIIFDDGSRYTYFGHNPKEDRIEGIHLVQMVKREINQYIEKYGIPQKAKMAAEERPSIQCFNPEGIYKVIGKPVSALDLNHCYWRSAYLLGYISESLYAKGVKSGHKKAMLVSIGSLNSLPLIQHYNGDKVEFKTFDYEMNGKYAPFYWHIISKVRDLMMEVYKALGNDMYMWLTDCAFVHPSRVNELREIYDKYGFPSKYNECDYISANGKECVWWDVKDGRQKKMTYNGRFLSDSYNKWKVTREFYNQDTILETETKKK